MMAVDSPTPPAIRDYTLLRRIGGGSYGEVWLARGMTGAYYAIKIVHRSRFDHARPFDREFAGIQNYEPVSRAHESQVSILHVGGDEAQGFFYYVMELADDASQTLVTAVPPSARKATGGHLDRPEARGAHRPTPILDPNSYIPRTLQYELKQRGRLPAEECVQVGLALTTALDHIHQHNLVHRDIKPSNIVYLHGVPRLADPGLVASTTGTRSFVGTEGYLPPEGPGSPQADLYSLGKVLYEISLGRDRNDFPELPTRLHEWPDRDLLVELNEVILKACHEDQRQRYASAAQMHADLALLQTGQSVIRLRAQAQQLRRLKRLFGLLLVLAGLAGLAYWQLQRTATQARWNLARAHLTSGEQLARAGDLSAALGWYAKAFNAAQPQGEEEQLHRLRLGALVNQCAPVEQVFAHQGAINAAVFSADGRWIATAGSDGRVQVWARQSGVAAGAPLLHPQPVRQVRFSPDARLVATACDDGTARVWELATGKLLASLPDAPGGLREVIFDPAGTRLAVTGAGGELRLWSLAPPAAPELTLAHPGPVRSLAFSADGQQLLTACGWRSATSSGGETRLWQTHSGKLLSQWPHAKPVVMACFNRRQDRILSLGEDGMARLWDVTTGQAIGPPLHSEGPLVGAAFGPEDAWIATAGGDQQVHFWDAATGAHLRATARHGSAVTQMTLSPDGQRVVTTGVNQTARVWNTATTEPALPPLHVGAWIHTAHFSPESTHLLTASGDHRARLWRLQPPGLITRQVPLSQPVLHANLSPSGSHLAMVLGEPGSPTEVRIWQITGTNVLRLPSARVGLALKTQFSPDGRRVVTAGLDGRAQVWDARTGEPMTPVLEHPFPVWQARFNAAGTHLATASSSDRQPGQARIWEIATGRLALPPLQHRLEVMEVAFSPDNRWLATGSGAAEGLGEASLWDAASGQRASPVLTHAGAIVLLAFSPDGTRLATAGLDQSARLWSVPEGRSLAPPLKHAGMVTVMAFSPDSRQLLTGGTDQTARLWDAATGAALLQPIRLESQVKDAAFHPQGRLLLITCADGTLSVWDAQEGALVVPPTKQGNSATLGRYLPDGQHWVSLGQGSGLCLWRVIPWELPLQAIPTE